jgi:hypothetical protein
MSSWPSFLLRTLSINKAKGPRLSLRPPGVIDAPCWIRTNDRLLRRQLLYPAELREQTLQSCQ